MKINKKEALALAKVLHQHTGSSLAIMPQSEHDKTVRALQARLDRFIMVDGTDVDHVDEDYRPKESSAKKQAQPCDFFDDGEDDDEDVFDEEDDIEQHQRTIDGGTLHDLKPATTKDGTLEFEKVKGRVDVLLAGEAVIEGVDYVRRTDRHLEVKSVDGVWTSFGVSKFPKGWASQLPPGELAMVEG